MKTILQQTQPRHSRRTGFSLIEVVLALLLFAMGVLGVMSIFPAASVQNRDAQDFTYSAQFARRVFNGVLAETIGRTGFWDRLSNQVSVVGCTTAMIVAKAPDNDEFFWQDPNTFEIRCYTGIQTVVFRSYDDTNVVDHVLRYKLTGAMRELPRNLQFDGWYPNITNVDFLMPDGTYSNMNVGTNWVEFWWSGPIDYQQYLTRYRDKTLELRLEIWPGRYGARNRRVYHCYVPRFW